MKFQFIISGQSGHGIGADTLWPELQVGVLARRIIQRFVGTQTQTADIMRQGFKGRHGAFQGFGGVNHHLVHLRQFDHTITFDVALAGQHITPAGRQAAIGGGRALNIAFNYLATTGAAAARQTAVRDRYVIGK